MPLGDQSQQILPAVHFDSDELITATNNFLRMCETQVNAMVLAELLEVLLTEDTPVSFYAQNQ